MDNLVGGALPGDFLVFHCESLLKFGVAQGGQRRMRGKRASVRVAIASHLYLDMTRLGTEKGTNICKQRAHEAPVPVSSRSLESET